MLVQVLPEQARRANTDELHTMRSLYERLLSNRRQAHPEGRGLSAPYVLYQQLPEQGQADEALLWMIYEGHIEHCLAGAPGRNRPRAANSLIFRKTSCFILTQLGTAFLDHIFTVDFPSDSDEACTRLGAMLRLGRLTPHYDLDRRVLSWGVHILKRFRVPAANQELLLRALQELCWPEWCDDPLLVARGKNAKVRLHDTIKDLNRSLDPPLIRFHGDGTGRRVGWTTH
ncbi:MAG TPA: hypothetical protein VK395_28705 [Gemmataceae bacterium]|nr:hypothetical protein [Gemmataceae bacterium]